MPSSFDIQELSRLASELWRRCETEPRLSGNDRLAIIQAICDLEAVLRVDDDAKGEALEKAARSVA